MRFSTPDLVRGLVDVIQDQSGSPCYMVRPEGNNLPRSFSVVTQTGGGGRNGRVLQQFQFTVKSYGSTAGLARQLADRIDGLMYSLVSTGFPVNRVRGTSPAESVDPDTHARRFVATYQLRTMTY